MRSAIGMLEALRSDHVRAQLKHKRWMLDEIETAVNDPDLLDLIEQGEFADVADNLVLLSLVLDARACQCLRDVDRRFSALSIAAESGLRAYSGVDERQPIPCDVAAIGSCRRFRTGVGSVAEDLDGEVEPPFGAQSERLLKIGTSWTTLGT